MFDYFQRLLGERGLAPLGFCLLWDPALIWTHVISDALIGVAYFSIPIAIASRFVRKPYRPTAIVDVARELGAAARG